MKYPVFRKRIDDTLVVCFISKNVGTVVVGNATGIVGTYDNCWFSAEYNNIWTDWNQEVKDLSCVVIENQKDLDEFNIIANSKIVAYCNTFPMVIWREQHLKNSTENDYFHRTQFKDYVVWSKDKEKAKKVLGFKTKFELKYDEPVLVGMIAVTTDGFTYGEGLDNGRYRTSKEQANLAFKSQIRQMRLGALIDQCGGQKEWVEGEENWYLYKDCTKWFIGLNRHSFYPEKIYCNKETAEKARDILNRGEYSLKVEE